MKAELAALREGAVAADRRAETEARESFALRFALATLCAAGCVATVCGTCSVGPAGVCALVPFWEPGVSQPLRLA